LLGRTPLSGSTPASPTALDPVAPALASGAILGHTVPIDPILRQQGSDTMRQQVIEELQVTDAKIGQGMIVDRDAAAEPAAAVVGTEIVHGTGTAAALDGGIQPQGHPDLRIGRGASRVSRDRLDVRQEGRQVQPWTNCQMVRAWCSGVSKSSNGIAGSTRLRSAQRRRGAGLGEGEPGRESSPREAGSSGFIPS
jgi:hypothetical protein